MLCLQPSTCRKDADTQQENLALIAAKEQQQQMALTLKEEEAQLMVRIKNTSCDIIKCGILQRQQTEMRRLEELKISEDRRRKQEETRHMLESSVRAKMARQVQCLT